MKLQQIRQNLEKDNYSLILSICRVFFCLIALRNLIVSLKFFEELYKGNSFLVNSNRLYDISFIDVYIPMIREYSIILICLYALSLIAYLFGIGRNYTAILVFILFDLVQRMTQITLNGGDNLLKFVFLYLCFADSFYYLSIDKSKQLTIMTNLRNNLVIKSIQIHLCLAYILSTVYKINTEVWFNGVATYYTFSLERFQGTSFNTIFAKNGIFVTLTTYATLLIELSFPYLIWFRETKIMVTIATIFLHMGIFIFMMIYDFQIIFIFLHICFYKNSEIIYWIKRFNLFEYKILNNTLKNVKIIDKIR